MSTPPERKERWDITLSVIQAIVATVMMWSLRQSSEQMRLAKQSLDLSQRQYEATIEPVVSIRNGGESIIVTNRGIIPVSRIEIIGVLRAAYVKEPTNSHASVMKHSFMDVIPKTIQEKPLTTGEAVSFSVPASIAPRETVFSEEFVQDNFAFEALGIIVCYRRNVDMKPFYQLLVTELVHASDTGEYMYFPLEPSQINLGSGGIGGRVSYMQIRSDMERRLEELGHKHW